MKSQILFVLLSMSLCHAQETTDEIQDPTRAGASLKAAMMSGGSAIPSITIGGMVIGGTGTSAPFS
jgi:hypothetical protein